MSVSEARACVRACVRHVAPSDVALSIFLCCVSFLHISIPATVKIVENSYVELVQHTTLWV